MGSKEEWTRNENNNKPKAGHACAVHNMVTGTYWEILELDHGCSQAGQGLRGLLGAVHISHVPQVLA